MELSWNLHGNIITLSKKYYWIIMKLSWNYHEIITEWSWKYRGAKLHFDGIYLRLYPVKDRRHGTLVFSIIYKFDGISFLLFFITCDWIMPLQIQGIRSFHEFTLYICTCSYLIWSTWNNQLKFSLNFSTKNRYTTYPWPILHKCTGQATRFSRALVQPRSCYIPTSSKIFCLVHRYFSGIGPLR